MERWWNTWESALYNLWFWGTVPLDLIILTLRQEHKILEGDIIRTTLNWKPYKRTQAACQGYRQSDLPLLFPFVGSRKTLSQASKRSRPQGLLETLYVRWWVFTWVLCSNKQNFELVVSGISQWMSFVRDKIKTDNDMLFHTVSTCCSWTLKWTFLQDPWPAFVCFHLTPFYLVYDLCKVFDPTSMTAVVLIVH